ncbi:MAG TPA: YraN family protein [Pseudonocardiaceae bacterium]|jgi:putative endonuclease|nr:YraN family protein [Pseudonocardiaceae bacterium]
MSTTAPAAAGSATQHPGRDPAHGPGHDPCGNRGHELGRAAENLAVAYLESHRLVVLSRNWRCAEGELDIVATDTRRLIVVEVKARSSGSFGPPERAVTQRKIARIRAATQAWRREYRISHCPIRFDVVSVFWPPSGSPRLHHLRGAF